MPSAALLHSPTPAQRQRMVVAASAGAAAIGAAVLAGWALDIEVLKSVLPGAAQMKPNTAAALVLAACAIVLPPRTHGVRRWVAPAIGLLVALLGAATLAQSMTGVDLGIDQWLFADDAAAFDTPPGRMSPFAAWGFVLVGACAVLRRIPALGWLASVCALQVIAIALLSLLGYLWNASELVASPSVPPLAVHTACAFLLLGCAVFMRAPRRLAGLRRHPPATASELSLRLSFWALVAALLTFSGYTYRSNVAFVQAAQAVTDTQLLRLDLSRLGLCLEQEQAAGERHRAPAAARPDAELAELRSQCGRLLRRLLAGMRAQPQLAGQFAPLRQAVEQHLREAREAAPAAAGPSRDSLSLSLSLAPAIVAFDTALALQEQDQDEARRAHRSSMLVSLIVTLLACITILAAVTRAMLRKMRENTRAREETERQKLLLSTVIDSSPDPVAYRAPDGTYLGANEAYARLVGRTVDELVGRGMAEVLGPRADQFRAKDELVLQGAEHSRSEDWFTYPDGSRRLMEVVRSPLRELDGRIFGVLSVARNMTERKAAADAVERARALAEESAQLKTAFLANMSHEIRTPMTAVLGLADLLAADGLNEAQRQKVEAMRASGRHLLSIINDILDFSRLEAGKLPLESVDLSLPQLLQDVESLLAPMAAERGIALDFVLQPGVPQYLRGDPTRLRQVLLNLAGNAVKFTPRGSVRVQIGARPGSGAQAQLTFEVRDTGIGIAPEKLRTLFSPFTQADDGTAREYGGSGLGLAISKRLAEAMGGRLEADSTLGKGSVFRFEVALPPGRAPIAGPAPSAFSPVARPRRILAAEDVPINREILKAALTRQGHHVEFAANGAEAVARVQAAPFDVVLMDMQMPVLDGLEATRRIRCLPPPLCDIPIVGLTANVLAAEQQRCLAAGMNECLNKPLDWERLAEAIARYGQGTGDPEGAAAASPRPAAAADDGADVLDVVQLDSVRAILDEASLVPMVTQAFAAVRAAGLALAGDLALPEVLARAHTIKGTSGTFAMAAIHARAAQIEAAAEAGERATDAIERLQEDIAATGQALRALSLLDDAAPGA